MSNNTPWWDTDEPKEQPTPWWDTDQVKEEPTYLQPQAPALSLIHI